MPFIRLKIAQSHLYGIVCLADEHLKVEPSFSGSLFSKNRQLIGVLKLVKWLNG
jgi:hypothetical protein